MFGHSNDRKWKIQYSYSICLLPLDLKIILFKRFSNTSQIPFQARNERHFDLDCQKILLKRAVISDILDKFDFGGQLYQICPIFRIGKWFDVGGWYSESLSPLLLFLEQKRCQKINLQKKLLFWGKKEIIFTTKLLAKNKNGWFWSFFFVSPGTRNCIRNISWPDLFNHLQKKSANVSTMSLIFFGIKGKWPNIFLFVLSALIKVIFKGKAKR